MIETPSTPDVQPHRRDKRKFAPLPADHPLVGDICPACKTQFLEGDVVTLIALGPGSDPEERRKARNGGVYNAVAAPVHWACATGLDGNA